MKQRNYGIDLMRIISMLYVIILHILGQGGVLNAMKAGTTLYDAAWFLEIWAYCAVDIFGLISGYVGFHQEKKSIKYANYISLWLEVVFYGVIVTFAFWLYNPELVSKSDFLQMCFPVTGQLYWYFTAYTGLVILMPFLNYAIQQAEEKTLKKLLIVLTIVFSCYSTFVDVFTMQGGYTFIWLVILYLIGAIIKKCKIGENISPLKAFIWIIILMVITWIWKLNGVTYQFLNIKITPDLLVSYTSPTVVITAMFYLIGASKLKISKSFAQLIEFGGTSAFSVYILNVQRFIWNDVMNQRFVFLAGYNSGLLCIQVIGFAAVFVIISILIDKIRILIFKILHVKQFSQYVDKTAHKIMDSLIH